MPPVASVRAMARRRILPAPPFLWLLAAMAITLRAAIPSGWMPIADAGGIRVALCTRDGPAELMLGADGQWHKPAPAPAQPRDTCPYALVSAQAGDLPQPPAVAPRPIARSILPPAEPGETFRATPRLFRPPATGPPVRA